jgi:hypothetical protein
MTSEWIARKPEVTVTAEVPINALAENLPP